MPDGRSKYIELLNLAAEWAEESGAPMNMVLRHLCEWAVAGGFPEGAFMISTGDEIPPLDVLTAFRLVAGNGRANIAGYTAHKDPAVEIELLRRVLVPTQAVLDFCERTSTRPPASLRQRFGWLFARRDRRKNLAPPECPGVEEHVVRHFARRNAAFGVDSLRAMLADLTGKSGRPRSRRVREESSDPGYLESKWADRHQSIQEDIRRCGDEQLQQDLDALQIAWQMFVAEQHSAQAQAAEQARVVAEAVPLSDAIVEVAAIDQPAAMEPRLRIWNSTRCVRLDGAEVILTRRSFKLLRVMTEAAVESAMLVSIGVLESLVDGSGDKAVAQAVYVLKQELIRGGVAPDCARTLTENFRGTGYRLTLPASDIQIDD
ncbi:MAG: hypothetical protein JWL84_2653 [Rhodospirillales bacterium]|nr:hypothetical protein [Rhodospirillales bacterium]